MTKLTRRGLFSTLLLAPFAALWAQRRPWDGTSNRLTPIVSGNRTATEILAERSDAERMMDIILRSDPRWRAPRPDFLNRRLR